MYFCLKLKREERKVKNKIVGYSLQLHDHGESGFDTWIVLKSRSCDKNNVNIIRNVKGIIELKVFIGYIQNNKKQTPQCLHFRCGVTHLNHSSKKIGRTFELQKELLKT